MEAVAMAGRREPWNDGKLVGQRAPFKLKEIWALPIRLQLEKRVREMRKLRYDLLSRALVISAASDCTSTARRTAEARLPARSSSATAWPS